ncbi:MAG: hypothetical protein WC906_04225 [Parcubacteria group bacterium]|jgi:hypothetical protein
MTKAIVISKFYLGGTLQEKGSVVELTPEQFDTLTKKNCVKECSKSEQMRIAEQMKPKKEERIEDREITKAPVDRMLRPRKRSARK